MISNLQVNVSVSNQTPQNSTQGANVFSVRTNPYYYNIIHLQISNQRLFPVWEKSPMTPDFPDANLTRALNFQILNDGQECTMTVPYFLDKQNLEREWG